MRTVGLGLVLVAGFWASLWSPGATAHIVYGTKTIHGFVAESDLVLPRLHGLSPFQGTELNFLLRNLGVKTIVGVGVSVNVAIQSFAFDAVNAGYQMVIPRDAVAGFPAEYVDAVFANTLGAVASLVRSEEILAIWS